MQKLNIISETAQYIVVHKPAGVNVEQWIGFDSVQDMVSDYLRTQQPKREPFVGVVHRLDRPVSGVLVLAKKKSALKLLNQQFAEHRTTKRYKAIVSQRPSVDSATLTHYIYVNNKLKKAEIYTSPRKDAHECRLIYRVEKALKNGYLLDIQLLTGKFHQIRAQLSFIGCPILGDEKYGSIVPYRKDAIALHAYQLAFNDLETNEKLTFEADFEYE